MQGAVLRLSAVASKWWVWVSRIVVGIGVVTLAWLGLGLVRYTAEATAVPGLADGRRPGGALVIVGGGSIPDAVRSRFLELAGGPKARIVLIPAGTVSDEAAERMLAPWLDRGMASASVWQARTREQASDPRTLGLLDDATGIWLGGGNQGMFEKLYAGTALEDCLRAILDRGGAVGGSSAGAAALCKAMIAGGHQVAVEGRGFDLLPGAVIDQHFLRRNRLRRLLGFLEEHPGLIGLGVDEGTALVCERRGGQLSVVGESYVIAIAPAPGDLPRFEILKQGDAITLDGLRDPDTRVIRAIELDEAISGSAKP